MIIEYKWGKILSILKASDYDNNMNEKGNKINYLNIILAYYLFVINLKYFKNNFNITLRLKLKFKTSLLFLDLFKFSII